jgi:hypothetical protein
MGSAQGSREAGSLKADKNVHDEDQQEQDEAELLRATHRKRSVASAF